MPRKGSFPAEFRGLRPPPSRPDKIKFLRYANAELLFLGGGNRLPTAGKFNFKLGIFTPASRIDPLRTGKLRLGLQHRQALIVLQRFLYGFSKSHQSRRVIEEFSP